MEQLTDQQRPLGEQVMKVSSVGLAGPYNPMMRSPVLGQRLFDLFHYLRWETSVPTKLKYDFVTELTTQKEVSDATYSRAKKIFNDQQIVDLTSVAGCYVSVAMLLAMAEETTPPGKEAPFKPGEP